MSQSNVTPQTFAALARQAMITSTLFSSILNRYRVGPEERRARALQTRAEHVANGELPGSSRHPHAVPIGFSMVSATPYTDFASAYSGPWFPVFDLPVEDALEATVGENEVWFDQDGNAFISFADKQDAMMFRLALDGDLS